MAQIAPGLQKKSELIISEIDALMHHGNSNPEGIGYLDILRIIDRVNYHFEGEPGKTPKTIEGSMDIAKGLCSPSELERINFIRKGIGLVIAGGGGFALIWGIVTIIAVGVTTTVGHLWWASTVLLLGGPIGILAGIVALASGIYFLSSKLSPKQRALKAHEIIRDSIKKWGEVSSPKVINENVKWFVELSDSEQKAVFCLAYNMANADGEICQSEIDVLVEYINLKPGVTDYNYSKSIELNINDCINSIKNKNYTDKVMELIKKIVVADGKVDDREKALFNEFKEKMS